MASATMLSTAQPVTARSQRARLQSGVSASTSQPSCFFQPRFGRVYSRRAPSFPGLSGRAANMIGRSGMWGCGPGMSSGSDFLNKPLSEVLQQIERDFSVATQQAQAAAQQAQQRQRQQQYGQQYGRQYGRTSYNDGPSESQRGQMSLPVDTIETEDAIWYFADLPGLEKKDVQIKANQQKRTITVEGERLQPTVGEDDDKQNRNLQRRFGKFLHTIQLPKEADPQLISAKVDMGVLRIKVLKNTDLEAEVQTVNID